LDFGPSLRERLAPDSEGATRKARFAEEQIVAIIHEADREPVPAVAKQQGNSEQTIYTWRKRFGGFQANDARRLKQLGAENTRLKKLVAERDLEIKVMKEVAAKNGERAGSSAPTDDNTILMFTDT
jgi:putative transposase